MPTSGKSDASHAGQMLAAWVPVIHVEGQAAAQIVYEHDIAETRCRFASDHGGEPDPILRSSIVGDMRTCALRGSRREWCAAPCHGVKRRRARRCYSTDRGESVR